MPCLFCRVAETEKSTESEKTVVAAKRARVEQDVLVKLREFDIEEAAGPLAQHGFKKMRTLQRMEDRFPKDIACYQLQR